MTSRVRSKFSRRRLLGSLPAAGAVALLSNTGTRLAAAKSDASSRYFAGSGWAELGAGSAAGGGISLYSDVAAARGFIEGHVAALAP